MKKYSTVQILTRANELGIVLWISNGEIQAAGPDGTLTDQFHQVIDAHKQELLLVLPRSLCSTCLDEGREVSGPYESPDEFMYCSTHKPRQQELFR